jgi:hypothetical protein
LYHPVLGNGQFVFLKRFSVELTDKGVDRPDDRRAFVVVGERGHHGAKGGERYGEDLPRQEPMRPAFHRVGR